MKNNTTSDKIKALLTAHPQGGGLEQDWKRISKQKGDAGILVRAFKNVKTKQCLSVIEYPEGRFEVAGKISVTAQKTSRFLPVIETDAAANQAADEWVALYIKKCRGKLEEDGDDKMEELAEKAGLALGNRLMFTLDTYHGEDSPSWIISPLAALKDKNLATETYMSGIHYALPEGASESCESCYEIGSGDTLKEASGFFAKGFFWYKEEQLDADQRMGMDNSAFTARLEQEQAAAKAVPSPKTGTQPKP